MERNEKLATDVQQLEPILAQTAKQATRFLSSIEDRPVGIRPRLESPGAPDDLPVRGVGAKATLEMFAEKYSAGLSASAGPRYLGFVTGGATPAAVAGDWLVSAFDQNAATSGDSCARLVEDQALRWLAHLFGLSAAHAGSFVSGATMANFVSLAIAREWVGHRSGVDVSQTGLHSLPKTTILSASPHSCVYKALSMLGLGRNSLRQVKCLTNREAVDPSDLVHELRRCAAAGEACIVVANAGTVNSADFDDLSAVARLKEDFEFWLHVDAAFGGFAACSPKYAHLVRGLDAADSVAVDAHKWLNVPYDSAVQFTRHRRLQARVFGNSAAYLGSAADSPAPEFLHLTPENSRRFRALPAWCTIVAYGAEGCRDIVEQSCDMARSLGARIEQSPGFRLLAPVRLNVVCFTLTARDPDPESVNAFVGALNDAGRAIVTPTVYKDVPGIRAAFSNWRTRAADVDVVWKSLWETYENGPGRSKDHMGCAPSS